MSYLLSVLGATGATAIFMLYASVEASRRGLSPVPVLAGNYRTVRERLGYEQCQGNARYRRNPIARNVTTALHAGARACKSTEIKSQTARAVTALARSSFWLQADTPAVTSKWMPMWQSYTYTPDMGGIFEMNILSRYPEEMKCSNAGHAEPNSGHSADGSHTCAKPTDKGVKWQFISIGPIGG